MDAESEQIFKTEFQQQSLKDMGLFWVRIRASAVWSDKIQAQVSF